MSDREKRVTCKIDQVKHRVVNRGTRFNVKLMYAKGQRHTTYTSKQKYLQYEHINCCNFFSQQFVLNATEIQAEDSLSQHLSLQDQNDYASCLQEGNVK